MLSGQSFRDNPGNKVWERYPQAIISIDLAKREGKRETLDGYHWDMVVVDEAHRMSADKYGRNINKTQSYQLGEVLRDHTHHFLLMTATPHRGKVDNFRLLLSLLDRDMFGEASDLRRILRQKDLPIFLRRMKENLVDFDGKLLFPPRKVETIRYELQGAELQLYEDLTEYVTKRYELVEQMTDKRARNSFGLALAILQRRMASSLRSIRTSLKRRQEKLEKKLKEQKESPTPKDATYDDTDKTDEERWAEEDILLGIPFDTSREIEEVERLYQLALQAEQEAEQLNNNQDTNVERKLQELHKVMHDPLDDGRTLWESGEKLLIFTENRDTLDYLVEKFKAWGFTVAKIHGSMGREERAKAQDHFRDPHGAQVLVATEAAGEGINLQFCRLMVNYDIPWNPNRLEQRMGRIHRYGQKYSAHIFNLVAANTREGNVLATLLEKVKQMRHDLGKENVYDVIGDLLSATELAELVQKAVREQQSLDEIQKAVSETIGRNEKRYQEAQEWLSNALADEQVMTQEVLDKIQNRVTRSKEQQLVPEYVEHFFVESFRMLCQDKGLKSNINRRTTGVWNINSIPQFIRQVAPKGHKINHTYSRVIFKRSLSEEHPDTTLITLKHPLFEAILSLVREQYGHMLKEGTCFMAGQRLQEGVFRFFEITIKDGNGAVVGQKLVGVHQAVDGECTQFDPLMLLDVEPVEEGYEAHTREPSSSPHALPKALQPIASDESLAKTWCQQQIAQPYKQQIQEKRDREANIQEEYVQRSLQAMINQQKKRISEHIAKEKGKGRSDIGLWTLEQRLEEHESRLEQRMDEIKRARSLLATPPRIIGICGLIAVPDVLSDDDVEEEDPKTEAVAIEMAKHYEREQGRTPQSVEADGLGFDLRSCGKELHGEQEIRYIEVKGRKKTGAVKLTTNEWLKAARFCKAYWLYVVYHCESDSPRLIVIQDPFAHFTPSESIHRETHLTINQGDVEKHGREETQRSSNSSKPSKPSKLSKRSRLSKLSKRRDT